ncbi:MAG: FHA domain-containing protein [Acidobacteriota bacterium]
MRYRFGEIVLDTAARQLARGPVSLHLSPKAFDLLTLLISERPRAMHRQEIVDALWPTSFVVDANLPNLIGEVRRSIGDAQRDIIRTVHGTGYAFASPIHEEDSERLEPDCAHLILVAGREHYLSNGEHLVGRQPTADVFLSAGSVSRKHALIRISGGLATVTDLESKHGTFIGNKLVREESRLTEGDRLRFGRVEVRYRALAGSGATDSFLPAISEHPGESGRT